MENGPFIDDFPINTTIYKGFSMTMSNNQMVSMNVLYSFLWSLLNQLGGRVLEQSLRQLWHMPTAFSTRRCGAGPK